MDVGDLGLLFVAGIGAGVVGSTAGLASLASYPALLLVGLPPVTANVTNTVGLFGSTIGSVSGSRTELRGQGPFLRRWLPVAAAGGLAGAALLLLSPSSSFEAVVPFLVAFASLLMLAAPTIRRRRAAAGHAVGLGTKTAAGLVASCAYGGYFGAAAGVMILALLLGASDAPLPVSNALKNALLGVANAAGAVLFALVAPVDWAAVPFLFVGCVLGGRLGPAVVRRVPEDVIRWGVGVAGLALAAKLGIDHFG